MCSRTSLRRGGRGGCATSLTPRLRLRTGFADIIQRGVHARIKEQPSLVKVTATLQHRYAAQHHGAARAHTSQCGRPSQLPPRAWDGAAAAVSTMAAEVDAFAYCRPAAALCCPLLAQAAVAPRALRAAAAPAGGPAGQGRRRPGLADPPPRWGPQQHISERGRRQGAHPAITRTAWAVCVAACRTAWPAAGRRAQHADTGTHRPRQVHDARGGGVN